MSEPQNVFMNVPDDLPDELIETLVKSDHVRIDQIISHGHASPEGFWYEQETSEWVMLLRGAALLCFENQEAVEMHPGSFINIPAHLKHRVEWTDPDQVTFWLAIHYR